jgi:hypothetical protein
MAPSRRVKKTSTMEAPATANKDSSTKKRSASNNLKNTTDDSECQSQKMGGTKKTKLVANAQKKTRANDADITTAATPVIDHNSLTLLFKNPFAVTRAEESTTMSSNNNDDDVSLPPTLTNVGLDLSKDDSSIESDDENAINKRVITNTNNETSNETTTTNINNAIHEVVTVLGVMDPHDSNKNIASSKQCVQAPEFLMPVLHLPFIDTTFNTSLPFSLRQTYQDYAVAQVRDFVQSKGQLTTTKVDAKIDASNYIREKGWPQFKFIENERQLEYGSSICKKSVLKYHKIKDYIQVPPGRTLNAIDVKKNLKVHRI